MRRFPDGKRWEMDDGCRSLQLAWAHAGLLFARRHPPHNLGTVIPRKAPHNPFPAPGTLAPTEESTRPMLVIRPTRRTMPGEPRIDRGLPVPLTAAGYRAAKAVRGIRLGISMTRRRREHRTVRGAGLQTRRSRFLTRRQGIVRGQDAARRLLRNDRLRAGDPGGSASRGAGPATRDLAQRLQTSRWAGSFSSRRALRMLRPSSATIATQSTAANPAPQLRRPCARRARTSAPSV